MLARYNEKLKNEPTELQQRIRLIKTDATKLDLDQHDFALALLPFNTLLCIPDFQQQQSALNAIGAHMRPSERLVVDLINPHRLSLHGDATPKPFFTRRNVWTGRQYTRFAATSPMDAEQCQKLYGWYDELREDGAVERKPYSITWRPLFRFEAELMLEKAGFKIEKIEGGHHGEPFTRESPKMFIWAQK